MFLLGYLHRLVQLHRMRNSVVHYICHVCGIDHICGIECLAVPCRCGAQATVGGAQWN